MTWRALPERGEEPRRIGESLNRVVGSLGGGQAAPALAAIFARWAAVVGTGVADHSWPLSLRDGILVIGVESPIWRTQLTFLEGELLRRMADALGPDLVTSIEVRVRSRRPPEDPS